MEKEKRNSKTSSAVKNRYANKVYGTILVKLPKTLVSQFKTKCSEKGVSQAQIIREAVERFLDE